MYSLEPSNLWDSREIQNIQSKIIIQWQKFTFKVLNVSLFFLESFRSLSLPTEGRLSESTSAFLLGVSRLSAPSRADPGESLQGKVSESSFCVMVRQGGVTESAFPPWWCAGEVTVVRSQLKATFFLLLSMSKILIQNAVRKGMNTSG